MPTPLSHRLLKNKTSKLILPLALLVSLAAFSFSTGEGSTQSQTMPTATPFGGGRGQIMYTSNRDGNAEIYTMNADGSNVRRLTYSPSADYSPAWSPNGLQLAFTSNRDGNSELYLMDADGTNVRRLTTDPDDDYDPAWSPDGTRIAFTSHHKKFYNRDVWEVHVINVDDTNSRVLTDNGMFPTWSPDGTQIAFSSDRDIHMRSGIFLMDTDGTNVRRLDTEITDTPLFADLAWSPDGHKIAYVTPQRNYGLLLLYVDVYVINADGSNNRRLTDEPTTETTGGAAAPAWSPDGAQIAFTSNRDGNREIYVMNADGSNQRNITNNPADDSSPAWRP